MENVPVTADESYLTNPNCNFTFKYCLTGVEFFIWCIYWMIGHKAMLLQSELNYNAARFRR